MLDVVGSNLKMVKFFMQHLWMLHDVVVVWPNSCANVELGHVPWPAWSCSSSIFNSQLVATRCNRVAKRTIHVAPTVLRSVAFKCCDRLAEACKCWDMLRCCYRLAWPFNIRYIIKDK